MSVNETEKTTFENIAEFTVDSPKRYDLNLGSARRVLLSGSEGDVMQIRMVSDTLSTIQDDFRIKVEVMNDNVDIHVKRQNGMTEEAALEKVEIFIMIPSAFIRKIEVKTKAESVDVQSIECENIELDVKTSSIQLKAVFGTVEIDCNLDMNILCEPLNGEVDINQRKASSRIWIPENTLFRAQARGIGTSISYEKNGSESAPFDTPDAQNVIELNGMKSSLVICTSEKAE